LVKELAWVKVTLLGKELEWVLSWGWEWERVSGLGWV
jgi:hypothetical protein